MSDLTSEPNNPPPNQSLRFDRRSSLNSTGSWRSATKLIIATNIVVFIVMGSLGAGWTDVGDMSPYILYGANNGGATTDGEWWRLITSMFLHFGVVHLLLNMWALYQAGELLERAVGKTAFFLVYFGSGILGSFVTIIWHGDKIWSAGASGAIFGVYGAIIGYMLREKHGLPRGVYQPILKSTLLFTAYNLFYGFMHPQIDNADHLGGLAGGLILGWLVAPPTALEARDAIVRSRRWAGLAAIGAFIVIGYSLSPHFAYRFRDKLLWTQVNRASADEEPTLIQSLQTALQDFETTGDSADLANWLEQKGIPFYAEWNTRVSALPLDSTRETGRRRDRFVRTLQLKIASYRRLDAALVHHQPDPLRQFLVDQKTIAQQADADPIE